MRSPTPLQPERSFCSTTTATTDSSSPKRMAQHGDIVTIDLDLRPEDGFVPEHLFDTTGRISFVLGWGGYLPALHELVQGMAVGDAVQNASIDAGFGKRNADLVIEVPKSNLKRMQHVDKIKAGATLNLQGGIKVQVMQVNQDTIVVDANHPLAGSSYACSLKLLGVESMPTDKMEYQDELQTHQQQASSQHYQVATLAMGCFWGIELAMMRIPGVVGTRVGYTQGTVADPSYQQVCQGKTKHREAVLVVYDSRVVSYQDLLTVYGERLASTESQYTMDLFKEKDDDDENDDGESLQYKNGIYFHNAEQRKLAQAFIDSNHNRYDVELKQAAKFYDAEDDHQQYLYKGGQSSRKNARETIRCFG